MANNNAPFGLAYDGVGGGGAAPTASLITRQIAYDNATKIYHGDPVLNLSTGYIGQWVNGQANYLLAGVFVGCRYLSNSQGKIVYSPYWPGADAAANSVFAQIIPCVPGVAIQFYAQSNSSSVAIAFADIGQNCDITVGTGSTITGLSGATLSNLGTTNTLPFKIVGLYDGVGQGSDTTTPYNWVYVTANLAGQTGV